MSPKYVKPTESELEILQILWNKGLATVREVHEETGLPQPLNAERRHPTPQPS